MSPPENAVLNDVCNKFTSSTLIFLNNYYGCRIPQAELVSGLEKIASEFIIKVEAAKGNELIITTKFAARFFEFYLELQLKEDKFNYFVAKFTEIMLISLKKGLRDVNNFLNCADLHFIKILVNYMFLSPKLGYFNFYNFFSRLSIKKMLNYVNSPCVDSNYLIYLFVLFSATRDIIPNDYATDILKAFSAGNIDLLISSEDKVEYLIAINNLLSKISKDKFIEFLLKDNFKLLERFLLLIQKLYQSNGNNIEKYGCHLLVRITWFFRNVMIYGTLIDIPNYFCKIFANTFLEATILLKKLKYYKDEDDVKIEFPDKDDNGQHSISFWYDKTVNTISVMFIHCHVLLKTNFENCLQCEKYKPIWHTLGLRCNDNEKLLLETYVKEELSLVFKTKK